MIDAVYICAKCRKPSPRIRFYKERVGTVGQIAVGYDTFCCGASVLAIPYPDDDVPKEIEIDTDTALYLMGM